MGEQRIMMHEKPETLDTFIDTVFSGFDESGETVSGLRCINANTLLCRCFSTLFLCADVFRTSCFPEQFRIC